MNVYLPVANGGTWRIEAVRCNLQMQQVDYREWWCEASPQDYPRMLAYAWSDGEPFIVVEHDVLPWPGALDELQECTSPWCAFPYIQGVKLSAFLGCTKITPDGPYPSHDSWMVSDQAVNVAMQAQGWTLHLHWPPVVHLNPAYSLEPSEARGRESVRVL